MRPSQNDSCSREREIVKKGIERLEKQIPQSINVLIPRDQINIALLKKYKTVDVPAINSGDIVNNLARKTKPVVGNIR